MSGRVPYAGLSFKEAAVFLQQFPGFSGHLPERRTPPVGNEHILPADEPVPCLAHAKAIVIVLVKPQWFLTRRGCRRCFLLILVQASPEVLLQFPGNVFVCATIRRHAAILVMALAGAMAFADDPCHRINPVAGGPSR